MFVAFLSGLPKNSVSIKMTELVTRFICTNLSKMPQGREIAAGAVAGPVCSNFCARRFSHFRGKKIKNDENGNERNVSKLMICLPISTALMGRNIGHICGNDKTRRNIHQ